MTKVFAGAHITVVLALIAAAIAIWRLRCEGFGCLGVGVAWFAWVVAFFGVLGLGLLARSAAASAPGLARASRLAWWVQVVVGVVAVALWLFKNAA
jgi:hypothetical protein